MSDMFVHQLALLRSSHMETLLNSVHMKQTQAPISIGPTQHAKATMELIHSDLCGPLVETPGGRHYFVLFIDNHMRYT